MTNPSLITFPLIVLTGLLSYRGFNERWLVDKYSFEVEKVLVYRQFYRLITSGFFHINWFHLIFNMLTFYFFSGGIGSSLGIAAMLLIYFGGMTGGNLIALFIHRNHGTYRAVGASGGVYALIFASIALFPGMQIGFFLLPISFPTWFYGLLFLGFSLYGIRSKKDNVGHESHLGGALVGMLLAIILVPSVVEVNYLPILVVLIPILAIMYIIVYRPHLLMVDNLFYKRTHPRLTMDQRYNLERKNQQMTIDKILDKIHRKGINSLSREEKKMLEEYSKK